MTLQSNNPVAPLAQQGLQDVPLKIVGGNQFGRYSKISAEATWNMIVSDKALVPYAGYKSILAAPVLAPTGVGRGIYSSTDGDFIIIVIGENIYKVDALFNATLINVIPMLTSQGDVFITENNGYQIVITDGVAVYVYNWQTFTFYGSDPSYPNNFYFGSVTGSPGTPKIWGSPGYCSFQNGRVIIAVNLTQQWVLSAPNDATLWPNDAQHQGLIQSKPGFAKAAVPVPGGGNNLMVFGSTVAESWTDVGAALFKYQRNSTFNVDYGVVNPSSIAGLDNYIVWISTNELSGPTVMVSTGGNEPQSISTDGIDFLLSSIKFPNDVTGFLFRQDGHVIYQFTFNLDNISLAYDFNTKLFFYVTDESLNYHPARQVVFYRGSYFFVSFNDQNMYKFDTSITDIQYSDTNINQIPRIRITPPLRLLTQRNYILRSVGFTVEQGQLNPENGATAAIDLSISRDGGQSFGSSVRTDMNFSGNYKSRYIQQRLGIANDASCMFRFNGFNRFVVFDGLAEIYQ